MLRQEEVHILHSDGVAVLPTNSVYGLMASITSKEAVERVYMLKDRQSDKPCIVLVEGWKIIEDFGVSAKSLEHAKRYWPGNTSIVMHVNESVPEYLHRGTGTLAFRVPDYPELQDALERTGPLIAPSANPEGLPPATTIEQARNYFGEAVDFYIDGGIRDSSPSRVISIDPRGNEKILRS